MPRLYRDDPVDAYSPEVSGRGSGAHSTIAQAPVLTHPGSLKPRLTAYYSPSQP